MQNRTTPGRPAGSRTRALRALSLALLLALGVGTTAPTAAVDSTLPDGTAISVEITSPADGDTFFVTAGETLDLVLTGTAGVGVAEPDATLIYVIDVSDSTSLPAGGSGGECGGDQNVNAGADEIIDCEVLAVLGLNQAAIDKGSVDEVGVVVFGAEAAAADMTPGGALLVHPAAGGHVETVVRSVHHGWSHDHASGVDSYAHRTVGGHATNFAAALQALGPVLAASTNSVNLVAFLSDGDSNVGGALFQDALDAVAATGAIVHGFAIGDAASCAGGSAGSLNDIAAATGGTCTKVDDPGSLPDVLPELVGSTLDAVTLSVDGAAPVALPNADISLDLPQEGAVTVDFSAPVSGLGAGAHTLCATAHGSDAGGDGDVTDCVGIQVVSVVHLDIRPGSCPNPLNVKAGGVLPVAILGTAGFDVSLVDPSTVQLEGVAATHWSLEDVATPFDAFSDPLMADDCTTEEADGWTDLTLKFPNQAVAAAIDPVADGDVLLLTVTGQLTDGSDFVGHDVVRIIKNGP